MDDYDDYRPTLGFKRKKPSATSHVAKKAIKNRVDLKQGMSLH